MFSLWQRTLSSFLSSLAPLPSACLPPSVAGWPALELNRSLAEPTRLPRPPAPPHPQPWLVGTPGQELRERGRCMTPATGELEPWMFAFTVS